jgi:hypothetical protein
MKFTLEAVLNEREGKGREGRVRQVKREETGGENGGDGPHIE